MSEPSAALLAIVDAQVHLHRASTGIAEMRLRRLLSIREFLGDSGFPRTFAQKNSLSLIPFIFQEANYDNIDWSAQDADLGHLAALFEVDAEVMCAGAARRALGIAEFAAYLAQSHDIIDCHKRTALSRERGT
jgi:hypothetical protein